MRGFGLNQHRSITSYSTSGTQGSYSLARVQSTFREDATLPYGAINFQVLNGSINGISDYALPLFQSYKSVPLVDEHVFILIGPGINTVESQAYYLPPINLWNHPQHGGKGPRDTQPRLSSDFIETSDSNPMVPFPGDILLEGRRGQSIRFSETLANKTPWKSKKNNQPVIAIVNGQIESSDGTAFITEDINLDPSSIYLTSNSKLDLNPTYAWKRNNSGQVFTSYFSGTEPQDSNIYEGAQIMLNSGRIYLNAKEDSILLSSVKTIGLIGDRINLDGVKSISLEAPSIFLTGPALHKIYSRSAVRGEDLVSELEGLYNHIADLSSVLTTVLTALNFPPTEAAALINYIYKDGPLKPRLEKMLSNRVKLS